MIRIAFTGGGTGGHIFPGIAVARALADRPDVEMFWIGSSSGRDRDLVTAAGMEFSGVPSGKLRRYFSLRNVLDVFRILAGFFASLRILRKRRPDVLFSKGGFVSVPPCYAARFLGIPVVTHECDFSPGLATKLNARIAARILLSYTETRDFFSPALQERCTVTGNPVRPEFFHASAERGRRFAGVDSPDPVILVLGGSSGAESVNRLVFSCLPALCSKFTVIHQTGGKTNGLEPQLQSAVQEWQAKKRYFPFSFIAGEMPDVLATADLVLSRSGAGAVWESAAAGKPMVLLPLEKGSSRGDQVENAEWFARRGAAAVLSGPNANPENLIRTVCGLFDGAAGSRPLDKMAAASAALGSGGETAGPAAGCAGKIAEILLTAAGRECK